MSKNLNDARNEKTYLDEVRNLIKDMKYGCLTLIVQDGKVIQIDKTEKYRLLN